MILDTWILQRDMDIEDGEIVKSNFIFLLYTLCQNLIILIAFSVKNIKTVKIV